ncbi:GNAT family N-acetyltransferase [Streptomyces sp. NPDC093225]|uniref:GNAT family N-acetyltransferase n=1 Tax=Streptomyces sp. NPDC093225 TaxID=3366034 RepID=UPI003813DBF5
MPQETRRRNITIRPSTYDHPDAVRLNDQVQLEYAERYDGEGDETPLDPTMFAAPNGQYLLAYDEADGQPVASGGWRAQERNEEGYSDGDAELKRMYVVPGARGLGLARRILSELEDSARAAGRVRMVLETGDQQPEAITLYLSSGYDFCDKFGYYRFYDSSRCMAKPLAQPGS